MTNFRGCLVAVLVGTLIWAAVIFGILELLEYFFG